MRGRLAAAHAPRGKRRTHRRLRPLVLHVDHDDEHLLLSRRSVVDVDLEHLARDRVHVHLGRPTALAQGDLPDRASAVLIPLDLDDVATTDSLTGDPGRLARLAGGDVALERREPTGIRAVVTLRGA